MKINRKEIKKMIIQEMDLMGMNMDLDAAYNVMMSMLSIASFGAVFVSMLLMLGPIMFSSLVDSYFRGMFTDEEFEHFVSLSQTDPEAAKRFAESIRDRHNSGKR